MRIFLDSADLGQIERAVGTGLISGVTTNPSLLSHHREGAKDLLQAICAIVPGPVSLQVFATETESMIAQGRLLAAMATNVVVKLPLTLHGLKACSQLRGEGIAVNVTLCFSLSQAILAARAGASYISPFLGRFEDMGGCPETLLSEMRDAYDWAEFSTEILAASIRTPKHFEQAALCGADVATIPFSVFESLFLHPLTTQGMKTFGEDAEKMGSFFE